MIRANDRAELTGDHESHGDTEYRYTIKGVGAGALIVVSERSKSHDDVWDWLEEGEPICLAEFIDKHIDPKWCRDDAYDYKPFSLVKTGWHNLHTALDIIEERRNLTSALPTLRLWTEKGTMTSEDSNWKNVAARVEAIARPFHLDDVLQEVDRLRKQAAVSSVTTTANW